MRRTLFLLAIVAATGCGSVPDIETADVYKVYNQDKAMLLAEARFEDHYHVEVNAFGRAEVNWTNTPCPYADDWAVVVDGECYYGIMWGCDEMYVAMAQFDPGHTCHTALLHEFGHCLLQAAGRDMDAGHKNQELWDLVSAVRQETCDRGW